MRTRHLNDIIFAFQSVFGSHLTRKTYPSGKSSDMACSSILSYKLHMIVFSLSLCRHNAYDILPIVLSRVMIGISQISLFH